METNWVDTREIFQNCYHKVITDGDACATTLFILTIESIYFYSRISSSALAVEEFNHVSDNAKISVFSSKTSSLT